MKSAWLVPWLLWLVPAAATIIDFEADGGAVSGDASPARCQKNGAILNKTLAQLRPADVLLIPNKTFYLMGGVMASGLDSVTLRIDGTLVFSDDMDSWPRLGPGKDGRVLMCILLKNPRNLTLTSSGEGAIDGQGSAWWGLPGVGYLKRGENRPRLLEIDGGMGIVVEKLVMRNSPYWTFWAHGVDSLEVRHCHITARRTEQDGHGVIDLTAFNTDGFDVSGRNIHVHDCSCWNQDDSFCVKDNSENVLFERVNASGLGLTIGSIASNVRNVTFRDVYMHQTYKGIYLKFRGAGSISDVVYENVFMDEPQQWPIWIGPAQQSDSANLCAAHPCSLCWPALRPLAQCGSPANATYTNIRLRNVTVNKPKMSPGIILANEHSPMVGVVFEDVIVQGAPSSPFSGYYCSGVRSGIATGKTSPVPECFKDSTRVMEALV